MVSFKRGNQRTRCLAPMWLSRENCNPSTATGRILACALSATRPAPSKTFIRAPVFVSRPSGKIISFLPSSRTASTMRFNENGAWTSTGNTSTAAMNGFTYHFEIWEVWIANVGLSGRKDAIRQASM